METDDRVVFERGLRHAVGQHTGTALDSVLFELGWHDALLEHPKEAVSMLFELQGARHATSSALAHALVAGMGYAASSGVGAILPELGRSTPPGHLDAEGLLVAGLGTASLLDREAALVVARSARGEVAVVVPLARLDIRRIQGMDPDLGLLAVTGRVAHDAIESGDAPGSWSSGVALAQLAVGHELIGASRRMLELAREHALARIQFGRVIAKFQAVRHRLADTLVAIESGDAVLRAAWEDLTPSNAALAKALAGRGARTTARHCQQVMAGIGFTTEHEFHLYVRRALVLDEMIGSSRSLTRDLGRQLIETRQLPAFAPL